MKKSLLILLFLVGLGLFLQAQQPESNPFLPADDEQLAAQFYANKEYDKAARLYEKLLEKTYNPYLYDNYINCLIAIEDFKKAEKYIKKLQKENPGNPRFAVELGYIYDVSGDKEKARKQFEQILKELPSAQAKIIETANAFLNRKYDDYAMQVYQRGRKLIQDKYSFNYEIADLYNKKGNYSAMYDEYLNLIEADYGYLGDVQNILQITLENDPDGKKDEMLKIKLVDRSKKNPAGSVYPEMLYWFSVQQKDWELAIAQAKALDKRFNENGERIFQLAKILVDNKSFTEAIEAYDYLVKKGRENDFYQISRILLLKTRFAKLKAGIYQQKDLIDLERDYQNLLAETGKNTRSISLMSDLAELQAFYLGKTSEAISLLNEAIATNGADKTQIAECKLMLGDLYLSISEVWEATLLYSQVEKDKMFKNDPMGHLAKFKNARLSFYIGEFDWAKAQLDVLKAATSKLIANDAMELSLLISDNITEDSSTVPLHLYARAELLYFQRKFSQAIATLDSVLTDYPTHPLGDEVWMQKAKIYTAMGDTANARISLEKIISSYAFDILADDALFMLAEYFNNQKNSKVKAIELYQKLLIDYPGSLFVVEARKKLRQLKGDIVN